LSKAKSEVKKTKPRVMRETMEELLERIFDMLADIHYKLDRREASKSAGLEELLRSYKEGMAALTAGPTAYERAPEFAPPARPPDKWIFDGLYAVNLNAVLGGAEQVLLGRAIDVSDAAVRLIVRYGGTDGATSIILRSPQAGVALLEELNHRFPDWHPDLLSG